VSASDIRIFSGNGKYRFVSRIFIFSDVIVIAVGRIDVAMTKLTKAHVGYLNVTLDAPCKPEHYRC
jgi:hypothetical protein